MTSTREKAFGGSGSWSRTRNTLEAFALDAGAWKLLGTWHGDAAVKAAPFEAITIELAAFARA